MPDETPKKTPRRRPTKKADPTSQYMEFIERFGLPTALLVAACYFGFTQIVAPISKSYQEAIQGVAETSAELEKAIEENNREDSERVKIIQEAIRSLEAKIDIALRKAEK